MRKGEKIGTKNSTLQIFKFQISSIKWELGKIGTWQDVMWSTRPSHANSHDAQTGHSARPQLIQPWIITVGPSARPTHANGHDVRTDHSAWPANSHQRLHCVRPLKRTTMASRPRVQGHCVRSLKRTFLVHGLRLVLHCFRPSLEQPP